MFEAERQRQALPCGKHCGGRLLPLLLTMGTMPRGSEETR